MYFSKSKYCGLYQCEKLAWLEKYNSSVKTPDPARDQRMKVGNEVGDLAMQIFGDFEEVTVYTDGKLDIDAMIKRTQDCISRGVENICEASFSFGGLYCAVDVLRKTDKGYAIYEVKSSTGVSDVYVVDVSYQKYVLTNCGIVVDGCYVVTLDNSYVLENELDVKRLFKIHDVTARVDKEIVNVKSVLENGEKVLSCDKEPDVDIGKHCRKFYKCAYWEYCTRALAKPNVFDLYSIHFSTALKYYNDGIIDYAQLEKNGKIKNTVHALQISHYLHDMEDHVDKKAVSLFLNTINYPIYFLDFESVQLAVPIYKGTRPYQQVPFQYSLHILHEDGKLEHREFLAQHDEHPIDALVERLVQDVGITGSVVVYNKAFEKSRLAELALAYPKYADKLNAMRSNIVDLLVPFTKGAYYNKAMGSSLSIKSVLPALFPQREELNYSNLDGIHNGNEAMNTFALLGGMSEEEREKTRRQLLEYCKLDTYAEVEIFWHLQKVVRE